MRCVMLGTGGFAVPTYTALLASSHEVVALVTRPAHRGRGGRPPRNPMQVVADQRGLEVFTPESINTQHSIDWLASQAADILVVCDYGQILSAAALATTSLGGINLHASLLPEYRGAAPIHWVIYDGRETTGVSIIHMTPRLDAGPVLLQRETPIGADESAADVELRLAELGAQAVLDALQLLADWDRQSPIGQIQSEKQATKAPRLKKEHGQIDWSRGASQIACQIRAMKPWPGSYTFFRRTDGTRLRLLVDQATVVAATESLDTMSSPPGTVTDRTDTLWVSTSDGWLQLDMVQPEGKRKLSGAEFLRGYRLPPGTRLG